MYVHWHGTWHTWSVVMEIVYKNYIMEKFYMILNRERKAKLFLFNDKVYCLIKNGFDHTFNRIVQYPVFIYLNIIRKHHLEYNSIIR